MLLPAGMIYVTKPKASFTQIQTHDQRHAAEVAGTVRKLSEDKTNFSSSCGRNSSDWLMTIDSPAFSDGILCVGYTLNPMIAGQVKRVRR